MVRYDSEWKRGLKNPTKGQKTSNNGPSMQWQIPHLEGNFSWLLINHAYLFLLLQTIQDHWMPCKVYSASHYISVHSIFNTFVLTIRKYVVIFWKRKSNILKSKKNQDCKKTFNFNFTRRFPFVFAIAILTILLFYFVFIIWCLIEHMISQWTKLDLFCNRWRKQYM